jgi:hypothetical protein
MQHVAQRGCFGAGTPIRLITGEDIAVETLQPGDELDDGFGGRVTVVGLYSAPLGPRVLLDVAGLRLTADHPLWTVGGWQAIDTPIDAGDSPVVETEFEIITLDYAVTIAGGTVAPLRPSSSLLCARGLAVRAAGAPRVVSTTTPEDLLYCPVLDEAGTCVANGYVVGGLRVAAREPL